ncbi:Sat12 [Stachybotrys chartarum IBT 40293]|nr:Sat12 [Stachybotrys chartarum IBT 40293]
MLGDDCSPTSSSEMSNASSREASITSRSSSTSGNNSLPEDRGAVVQLPTLNPSDYRWHPFPGDSSVLQRKAIGVEALVGIRDANSRGEYDFYNNIVLRVGNALELTLTRLKRAFVKAMLDARFENPSIACYGVWGQNKEQYLPHIQYKSFKSQSEALAWANNCIIIQATSLTGSELRAERLKKRRAQAVPQPSNPLDIIIYADVANQRNRLEPGTEVNILFLFNHLIWDGKGRYFTSELVQRATTILDQEKENIMPTHRWGEEKSRLDPPILDVMLVNLDKMGPDYDLAHRKLLNSQLQVGLSWGLPLTRNPGEPLQIRHCISREDSTKITDAVRARLGPKYNIGHLGHAATVLSLLKNNPIPPSTQDTAFLFSPLPVDGRPYLLEERKTPRYGNAQAAAVVELQKLASWGIKSDNLNGVKVALDDLAKKVKEDYDYWLTNLVAWRFKSSCTSEFIAFGSAIYQTPYLDPGAPKVKVGTGTSTDMVFLKAFCNDGRAESIIAYTMHGPSGKELFQVDDCFGGVDVLGSNAFIRMDTWKDAIRLTLCYNSGCFSDAVANSFTTDVAQYMLAYSW